MATRLLPFSKTWVLPASPAAPLVFGPTPLTDHLFSALMHAVLESTLYFTLAFVLWMSGFKCVVTVTLRSVVRSVSAVKYKLGTTIYQSQ